MKPENPFRSSEVEQFDDSTESTPARDLARLWLKRIVALPFISMLGFIVGGVAGGMIVYVKGPVFHWEMAGMFMTAFAALAGGAAAPLASFVCVLLKATGVFRSVMGLGCGGGLGFAVGLWVLSVSSARAAGAPDGLSFWVVAMVVISSSISGLVGSLVTTETR